MLTEHHRLLDCGMELRQLRMFVAVARELNFRRAAEHCHIAQPALSRQIQALEAELGLQLFRRTRQRVHLTDSGAAFLSHVERSLAALELGVQTVRREAGLQPQLTVGFVEYANFPFILQVFRRFTQRCPDIRLVQRELDPSSQLDLLGQGELDVSFIGLPAVVRDEGIAFVPVIRTSWKLAVSADHPLAQQERVEIADLNGQPLVLFPRFINPRLYDWMTRCLSDAGVEARVVQEPAQLHTAVNLVAAGVGLLPTTFFLGPARSDVVLLPLHGFGSGAQISAAYRQKDASRALAAFLEIVREVARETPSLAG